MSGFLEATMNIVEWMEKNKTTIPPSQKGKTEEERNLGRILSLIRKTLIKPYEKLETEEERVKFREKYPEIEEIVKIVDTIYKNRLPIFLENAKKIENWMEENNTTNPPRQPGKGVPEEESRLGKRLTNIRQRLIKPYKKLKNEKEREEYRQKHPELDEVIEIIERIDKNSVPINLRNARKIVKWMEKNNTVEPPSSASRIEEERKLGVALAGIRKKLTNPYRALESEKEKEEYKERHPEIEEIMEIVENIDKNNLSICLENARKIVAWMEREKTTKPPSPKGKTKEECELGLQLKNIKQDFIKPYRELKTEKEKAELREKYSELGEVVRIVETIEKNKLPSFLENAKRIEFWMERNNTAKEPSQLGKTKEERRLGSALNIIRQKLVKPYKKIKTEEERDEFIKKHPEVEQVMEILEKLGIVGKKFEIPKILENARKVEKWMEENNTTNPPSTIGKTEEERRLGRALANIKTSLIKPYKELKTEEERVEFKEFHPGLDEVMEIVKKIDKNRVRVYLENAKKIIKWMEENNKVEPPNSHSQIEEECKLGMALNSIKQNLIKPYRELETEEEIEKFKEKHPEVEEVLELLTKNKLIASDEKQAELVILIRESEEKREVLNQARNLEKIYKDVQRQNISQKVIEK